MNMTNLKLRSTWYSLLHNYPQTLVSKQKFQILFTRSAPITGRDRLSLKLRKEIIGKFKSTADFDIFQKFGWH